MLSTIYTFHFFYCRSVTLESFGVRPLESSSPRLSKTIKNFKHFLIFQQKTAKIIFTHQNTNSNRKLIQTLRIL